MNRHPAHLNMRQAAPDVWEPAKPKRPTNPLLRWRQQRACRQAGGHWWHPDPDNVLVGWFCCMCPAVTEGTPTDGPRRGWAV